MAAFLEEAEEGRSNFVTGQLIPGADGALSMSTARDGSRQPY